MPKLTFDNSSALADAGYPIHFLRALQSWQSHAQGAFGNQPDVAETFGIAIRTASNQVPIDANLLSMKGIFLKEKSGKVGLFTGRLRASEKTAPHAGESAHALTNSDKTPFVISFAELQLRIQAGDIVPVPGEAHLYFDKADLVKLKGGQALPNQLSVYQFEPCEAKIPKADRDYQLQNMTAQRPYLEKQLLAIAAQDTGMQYQVRERKPNSDHFENNTVVADAQARQTSSDADIFFIPVPKYEFFNHASLARRLSENEYENILKSMDTGVGVSGVGESNEHYLSLRKEGFRSFIAGMNTLADFFEKNGAAILLPTFPDGFTDRGRVSPFDMITIHNVNMLNRLTLLKQNIESLDRMPNREAFTTEGASAALWRIRKVVQACDGLAGLCKIRHELKRLNNREDHTLSSDELAMRDAYQAFSDVIYNASLRSTDMFQHGPEMGNPSVDPHKVTHLGTDILHLNRGEFTLTHSSDEVSRAIITKDFLKNNGLAVHPTWVSNWDQDPTSKEVAINILQANRQKVGFTPTVATQLAAFGASQEEVQQAADISSRLQQRRGSANSLSSPFLNGPHSATSSDSGVALSAKASPTRRATTDLSALRGAVKWVCFSASRALPDSRPPNKPYRNR